MTRLHSHHENSGDTGSLIEQDYLYPANDPRRKILSAIDFTRVEYKALGPAIRACLENNPAGYKEDEAFDPPAGWVRDVHYWITQALQLEDWSKLKIVPALKTSADIHHGIDFMITYEDPETRNPILVTVDISLRQKDTFKADVLVTATGAAANDVYFGDMKVDVPDMLHADAKEDKARAAERRKEVGFLIAEIIKEKLTNGDSHYPHVLQNAMDTTRSEVQDVLKIKRRPRSLRDQLRHNKAHRA